MLLDRSSTVVFLCLALSVLPPQTAGHNTPLPLRTLLKHGLAADFVIVTEGFTSLPPFYAQPDALTPNVNAINLNYQAFTSSLLKGFVQYIIQLNLNASIVFTSLSSKQSPSPVYFTLDQPELSELETQIESVLKFSNRSHVPPSASASTPALKRLKKTLSK